VKKLLLACLLSLAVLPVLADPAASDESGNSVILHQDACTNSKVLAAIPPEFKPLFRSAEAFLSKKVYKACWTITPDGTTVALIYEDGDTGAVPVSAFHERGA